MIQSHSVTLTSPDATAQLAVRLGKVLQPGDCLLLNGPIGAGKTHFCRHLIQSLLTTVEDVPSPTFTLVQTYDTHKGELWHADLYRLTQPDEIEELGLIEAFDSAICLIEWPDRLGGLTPTNALTIGLAPDASDEFTRHLTYKWSDGRWGPVIN